MSTTTVDVLARLRADTSDFSSGMNQAANSAAGLNSKVSGHLQKIGVKFKQLANSAATAMSAAVGVLAVPALLKGWERMTTIQDSTVAIGVALGDTAKAAKLLDEVLEVVRGTPFNFDQFAAAAQQMVGMGVETEKIPRYLTAIGEASATQGKRANEYAGRLATVFGQVSAANRIMGDDIQSFQQVGVNALAILGNSFGVTTAEMREMISKGAIPATEALDILSDGILNGTDGVNGATVAFSGTMAGLRKTLSGAVGGVGAAVGRLGAAFLTPLSPVFISAANTASSALDKLAVYAKKLGTAMAESKAMKTFIAFLEKIPDKIGPVLDGMVEMKSTLAPLIGLIVAMASTNVAAAFGPLGALIPKINPLVGILLGLATQSAPLRQAFTDLMTAMQPVIKAFIDALMPIMDQLGELISTAVAPALLQLAPPFVELLTALIPLLPPLIELAKVIIPVLSNALLFIVSEGIVPLIEKLVPVITSFTEWTTELVSNKDAIGVLTPLVIGLVAAFVAFKTVAFVAGVIKGIAAAVGLLKAKMVLLNAAILANPIGALIAVAILLGAVIFMLWTNWDKVWGWIMDHKAYAIIIATLLGPIAGIVLIVGIVKYLWNNWDKIWGWIVKKALWVWKYIKPVWNALVAYVQTVLIPLWGILWKAVKVVFNAIATIVQWFWNNITKPILGALVAYVQTVLIPLWGILWSAFQTAWNVISKVIAFAWNEIIFPIFKGIVTWVKNNLIPAMQTIWDVVQNVWGWISDAISYAWENVIKPVWIAISAFIAYVLIPYYQTLWNVVQTVFNAVAGVISWVWNSIISPVFNWIKSAIGTLIDTFNTIKDGISSAFSTVFNIIVSPFRTAFNYIVDLWNNTAGKLKVSTPDLPGTDWGGIDFQMPTLKKWYHNGGLVQGSMSSQNVPTMLQAGELVVSRAQLKAIERGAVPEISGSQGVVNVYVSETNASPYDIGKEILWSLKVAR